MTSLLTVTLHGARYGLDVTHVREVLTVPRTTPVPLAPPEVAGLVNLRGRVITCLDLRTRLGLPPRASGAGGMLVVTELAAEPLGLVVDAVGDVVHATRLRRPPDNLDPALRPLIVAAHPHHDHLLLVLDHTALAAAPARTSPAKETPR